MSIYANNFTIITVVFSEINISRNDTHLLQADYVSNNSVKVIRSFAWLQYYGQLQQ